MAARNVVVAQSGGPTPVINNSLRAILDACRSFPSEIGTVYAGYHGIEGVLKEELIDLNSQSQKEIELLRTTPAAGAIGTCRYKLKEKNKADYDRVIEVFKAHDVGFFFCWGVKHGLGWGGTHLNFLQTWGGGVALLRLVKRRKASFYEVVNLETERR